MSTIKVDTIKNTSNVEVYTCKAWVNFDGTTNTGGSCTIRASGNVSSVTDNGTGNYNINFTTAMSDANYSAVTNDNYVGSINHGTTFSTTSYQVVSRNSSGSEIDSANICSAVFR